MDNDREKSLQEIIDQRKAIEELPSRKIHFLLRIIHEAKQKIAQLLSCFETIYTSYKPVTHFDSTENDLRICKLICKDNLNGINGEEILITGKSSYYTDVVDANLDKMDNNIILDNFIGNEREKVIAEIEHIIETNVSNVEIKIFRLLKITIDFIRRTIENLEKKVDGIEKAKYLLES